MLELARVTDNADPEGLMRVKVAAFGREAGAESDWAPVASPFAADKAGFACLPQPGDLVVVAWLDGDRDRPVVLGALWNGMAAVPEGEPDDQRLVSRKGHRIVLADGDADGITIEDAHGNKIVLSDKGIVIETGKDLTLTVGGKTLIDTTGEATLKGAPLQLNP